MQITPLQNRPATDYVHTMTKSLILCGQKTQIQNKNLEFGYKAAQFYWLINEKYGQGTLSSKMGAENTPNAQIVCPSPKVWDFDKKKASFGVRSPLACL